MRTILVVAMLWSAAASADEVTRTVGSFSGVHVGSGIQGRVETGPAGPVSLRGDKALLDRVKIEVKDDVVSITFLPDTRVPRGATVTALVRLPRATSLGVSGGSTMEANVPGADSFSVHASGGGQLRHTAPVSPRRFALHASGGSRISLAGVDTAQMEAHLSGAARAELRGRAERLQLAASGGAELDAAALQVGSLDVNASGGCRLDVRATRSVVGSLSGGTVVRVGKGVEVRVDLSGGARVKSEL